MPNSLGLPCPECGRHRFRTTLPLQEEKLGKQEVTEIEKDMTLGPMDAFKKKMGW